MVLRWITLSTSSQIWQLTGKFCRRVSHLLDLAGPVTVSPSYTVVHSHNNFSRCWAEGAHHHVHPSKEKPWVLTSPEVCSCTWVERGSNGDEHKYICVSLIGRQLPLILPDSSARLSRAEHRFQLYDESQGSRAESQGGRGWETEENNLTTPVSHVLCLFSKCIQFLC